MERYYTRRYIASFLLAMWAMHGTRDLLVAPGDNSRLPLASEVCKDFRINKAAAAELAQNTGGADGSEGGISKKSERLALRRGPGETEVTRRLTWPSTLPTLNPVAAISSSGSGEQQSVKELRSLRRFFLADFSLQRSARRNPPNPKSWPNSLLAGIVRTRSFPLKQERPRSPPAKLGLKLPLQKKGMWTRKTSG